MPEKTTEERGGVYIITTPDKNEHRAFRTDYRALMQKLRSWFPGEQLAVRFEEVQANTCGEVVATIKSVCAPMKLAG